MVKSNVLAMIMAGGKGERLYPLTLERSKPSVPFGGKYRIIDFVLSNFINSGIYSIYVLVQYKSQSLIEHIRTGWNRQGMVNTHFITVVPPQMRHDHLKDFYRGTADAIYQNLNLILDYSPEYVAVFGADHIYRMNIDDMVDYHESRKADVTISCIPTPRSGASAFGIVETDKDLRITGFTEKPKDPKGIPYNPDYSFVSMGNYIFKTDVLIDALEKDAAGVESNHDFGRDIIPGLIKRANVYAYDFGQNNLPGLKDHEEKGYWRDVGTIESFYNAHMDMLGEQPLLDLSNRRWTVHAASFKSPPSKIDNVSVENSLLGEGCTIKNARIRNSIIGRSVTIDDGVELDGAIVMDYTIIKRNCRIRHAIIDRFNTIEADTKIGYDLAQDKERYYVSPSGIVVLKRGPRRTFYW